MNVSSIPRAILSALALASCEEAGEDCEPGGPGCACLVGTCQPGLVCTDELCLYPSGGESDDGSDEEVSGSDEGPVSAGASSADAGPPEVLSLVTDSDWLLVDEQVQFIASVSDPDGVEDVQGGTVRLLDGPELGEFLPLGATGWQFNLTWEQLNAVAPIVNGPLSFEASFVDLAGNVDSAEVTIVSCEASFTACLGEECVDLMTDVDHCGDCHLPCDSYFLCIDGECEIDPDYYSVDPHELGGEETLIPIDPTQFRPYRFGGDPSGPEDALPEDVRREFDLPRAR